MRGISKTIDGEKVLDNVSFIVRRGDKIAFISDNELANDYAVPDSYGEMKPDEGSSWALPPRRAISRRTTTSSSEGHEENMLDWIALVFPHGYTGSTLRGFPRPYAVLRRRCFTKPVRVLSGGEKVRLMLARMMLFGSERARHRPADQPPRSGIHHRSQQRRSWISRAPCCLLPTTTSLCRPLRPVLSKFVKRAFWTRNALMTSSLEFRETY